MGACGFGYFADVQTIAQAEDAAQIWWALTGDDGGVIIRERDGGIVKVMDKDKNEMTDKEKIIEIIAPFISAYGEDEAIADALIAAGFGDVTAWKGRAEEKDKYSDILQLKAFCERNGIKCILERRTEDFNGKLKERDGYKITFMNGDVIQSADTNGYFEFYNRHNEVDGKRIEKTKAKSFVLRYKNWLNSNNKPKREIEEEEK